MMELVKFSMEHKCQLLCGLYVVLDIASDHMVHLLVLHDDVSLQYFMPAISS